MLSLCREMLKFLCSERLWFNKILFYCTKNCVKEDFFVCAEKWSPALQIRTVLLSIQALLSAPNPDDPLANDVAELWKVGNLNTSEAREAGLLYM